MATFLTQPGRNGRYQDPDTRIFKEIARNKGQLDPPPSHQVHVYAVFVHAYSSVSHWKTQLTRNSAGGWTVDLPTRI